jgi:hypothetical protein
MMNTLCPTGKRLAVDDMMHHPLSGWVETSQTISALTAALVESQTNLGNIGKAQTANVGQYRYTYADLPTILATVRPVLAANGLAVMQTAGCDGDNVHIWSTLLHRSGEFVMCRPLTLPAGKTAQQTGSAITYGRRYALLALLNLGTDDDDDGATAAPRPDKVTDRGRSDGSHPSGRPSPYAEPDPAGPLERPQLDGAATAKQLGYLRALMRGQGLEDWEPPEGLTKQAAADLITEIKAGTE